MVISKAFLVYRCAPLGRDSCYYTIRSEGSIFSLKPFLAAFYTEKQL
jgi:hypothetical protein